MNRYLILFSLILIFAGSVIQASTTSVQAQTEQSVLVRSTVRLYYQDECITLYSNGRCLMSMGDSQTVEATYSIEDEGNWIYFYIDVNGHTERLSARITMRGGTIISLSFNGHVYRQR